MYGGFAETLKILTFHSHLINLRRFSEGSLVQLNTYNNGLITLQFFKIENILSLHRRIHGT